MLIAENCIGIGTIFLEYIRWTKFQAILITYSDSYPAATYLFSQRNVHVERQLDARKKKKWRRFGFSSAFILLMHREFTKSSPLITARIQISDWIWVCNIPERPADMKPYDQSLAPFVLKAWTRTWYFVFLKSPLNKQLLPSEFVVQLCQVLLSIATSAR